MAPGPLWLPGLPKTQARAVPGKQTSPSEVARRPSRGRPPRRRPVPPPRRIAAVTLAAALVELREGSAGRGNLAGRLAPGEPLGPSPVPRGRLPACVPGTFCSGFFRLPEAAGGGRGRRAPGARCPGGGAAAAAGPGAVPLAVLNAGAASAEQAAAGSHRSRSAGPARGVSTTHSLSAELFLASCPAASCLSLRRPAPPPPGLTWAPAPAAAAAERPCPEAAAGRARASPRAPSRQGAARTCPAPGPGEEPARRRAEGVGAGRSGGDFN